MLRRPRSFIVLFLLLALASATAAQTARRPLKVEDFTRFRNVSDPQVSPDGNWVAYVVSTTDAKEDRSNSHIWMVNIDGSNNRQITFSNESESSPRWSPDGKYLSFTSSRPGKTRGNQVWLLDPPPGTRDWRSRSGVRTSAIASTRRHGNAARSETDRDRSLSIQAGRPGLPAFRSSHLHLSF